MSRILLLEDDLSLVTGLSFALKKQGFALNTARTLREADAAWADGSYDLLVLDVSLPDGSGFAFCEKVRRTSNVPIMFLMTGSFALMIVLFLAFSACLDIVHKLLSSVNSRFTPDFSIYSVDDTNSLDPGMADEIAALPGVKCTYGTMSRTAQPARINGAETTIDLYSYGDAMLDDAKRSVASGDLSKVYGDSGYALAIFSDATRLNVGDSVTVNGQTLEIACVLSEGIGSISGAPVIVCSGETFTRLTGETHYMLLNVLAEKDISDAAVQKLYALAGDAAVSDNRELQSEVNGSY